MFIETFFHSVNHIRTHIIILPVVSTPHLPKGSRITPEERRAEQTSSPQFEQKNYRKHETNLEH